MKTKTIQLREEKQQLEEKLNNEVERLEKDIESARQANAIKTQQRASVYPTTQIRLASATYPASNENIVWEFLINKGFTRNQTAGIMGNLQQEHNFQTSGDGLAQWTGGRRARLMSLNDPYNIYTQLNFMVSEMGGLNLPDDVVLATRVFQNQFERCNPVYCNEPRRISYAFSILGRH